MPLRLFLGIVLSPHCIFQVLTLGVRNTVPVLSRPVTSLTHKMLLKPRFLLALPLFDARVGSLLQLR